MKVTTEELERCEVLMTVEVDAKKEQSILQKAAKRIAREVKIPGFRPGKAPYNVVVRRFGLENVQQEALEQAADKLIQDALAEANLIPYARIDLDSIDWSPLIIKVKVPLKPVVELSNYRDIRLDFEPVEVTDEDVEEALGNVQDQNATWVPVERPAEIGDLVSMSIVEKDGDIILSSRDSVEQELDPPEEHEGHNHPDTTTPLLGLSAGEEKTFTLLYPEEYDDDRYAGKEITFDVSISSVKEKELDPLDDEFAQSFSDFDTLEEFKADIRQNLLEQRQRQQATDLGNKAIDQLLENSTVEWPQAFEDESVEQELDRYERQMRSYGLTIENYYQMKGQTKEEFIEEVRGEVVNQLNRGFVLGKIIEQEKLEVSESEILERAKLIADYSGGGDQMWRNILASELQRNSVSNNLLTDKALKQLAAIAKGEDPPVGTAESAKLDSSDDGVEPIIIDELEPIDAEAPEPPVLGETPETEPETIVESNPAEPAKPEV